MAISHAHVIGSGAAPRLAGRPGYSLSHARVGSGLLHLVLVGAGRGSESVMLSRRPIGHDCPGEVCHCVVLVLDGQL